MKTLMSTRFALYLFCVRSVARFFFFFGSINFSIHNPHITHIDEVVAKHFRLYMLYCVENILLLPVSSLAFLVLFYWEIVNCLHKRYSTENDRQFLWDLNFTVGK